MARSFYQNSLVLVISLLIVTFSHSVSALVLVDTENVSITAQVGTGIGGGTSSGGGISIPRTAVEFSGQAYPSGTVTLLKEGKEVLSVPADNKGIFSITHEESTNNNIFYSLYATDALGDRSLLVNYPIIVYTGYLTHLSGIRFAPTINIDKSKVKAGDYLTVSGYSAPSANLEVDIEGTTTRTFTLTSSNTGLYKIIIPLGDLPKGEYVVSTKYVGDTRFSKLVQFTIADVNILVTANDTNLPGDCNADHVINIVDFSVLAFWYGKLNPPSCVDTNHDHIIDLRDFSILAFYWTG